MDVCHPLSSQYSTELKQRLRSLYETEQKCEEAAAKTPNCDNEVKKKDQSENQYRRGRKDFDHPTALLKLEVENSASVSVECFVANEDNSRTPTIKMPPHSTVR